ncbi:unnamed protein product [Penicillium egyptiacum]|uniref:GED domain-containing protein n=1 Tax=Penicillium egyptiacum TaxID=1303716 RepID=A0A9W4KEJ0_9EURO|nr:unnamed protein product [Penicillium egyptiacum]
MVSTREPDPRAGPMLADPLLLEKIDKLFACNIGEYISLPQLVVVGDQSSGKSSALEGLTKLSFPRDSGLCTRFATQIIFRRDTNLKEREISASIIPSPDLDAGDAERLRAWKASGAETLGGDGFVSMMKEVHEVMGLSSFDNDGKPTFSNNVLCLEICGPDEEHLSVIDVPGIFKNTTPGRTTKNDIAMVRNMVLRYMQNRWSIMLTVVPANVDIATQEIIELAREVDPPGERTLRILTKPDLVDKGAEDKVIDLIEDQNASGQLGSVLVRNLGQQQLEDGNVNRDAEEEFFRQTAPWNRLRAENFGIRALKNRLQDVLASTVRREFPSVRKEVNKKLKASKDTLRSLGDERETAEQQQRLLLGVVATFQDITQQALTTNYGIREIFDDPELRLATLVANRNSDFAHDLTTRGHEYAFKPGSGDKSTDHKGEGERDDKEENGDGLEQKFGDDGTPEAQSILSRKVTENGDLHEILHEGAPIECSIRAGITEWISKLYGDARGFEIGTFNHVLLSTLMKKQSAKWPNLAQGYVSDVISYVHRFIQKALLAACPDSEMSSSILSLLMDELMDNYRQAISVADFLLGIERAGTPMTLNHYLNDNLQKCREKRFQDALAKKAFTVEFPQGDEKAVRLGDVHHQDHMSNFDHTVQDIHDILESYYKVARKRFVDNVCMQATDHYLVTGPKSPMKLLSPAWVNSLSTDQLEEIAGEDAVTRRRRQQLRKEIRHLESGRKALMI